MHLSLKIILVIYLTLSLDLCTTSDDPGIERVVIKGVSDYAADNKSDSDPWTLFCSLMAFSLVAHALRADVSKYRPEAYKSEKLKNPKKIHGVALVKLLSEIYFLFRFDDYY